MKKDYSDYKPTKNEIHNLNRSDRENVRLKYFYNYARFSKDDKRIHITVDEGNEYFSMNHLIEEYTGEEITAKNFANDKELPEYIERNKKQRDVFASRFQIDFEGAEYRETQYLWDKDKGFPKLPFNNVLSGARINLQYGEGILDFIYADFKSAIQEQLKSIEIENLLYKFAQQEGVKKEKSPIHKTDYRNFLFYKYFVANKQMLLITEGKTDVLYIKAALKSLYKEYPKLITKDSNGKFRYHLSFFSRSRHWSYFFGMGLDGADAMKSLYNYFVGKNGLDNLCDYFLKYKTEFSPHPTIMLFDNEKNTKRPLNKFIGYAELCELKKEQLEKENYVLLEPNCKLNLVSVPLPLGKSECELEDLFSEETLNIEIGGRKFSRKDENPQKYYNKDIFSKYIFQNYEKIDFTGFKPLLNILNMLNESNG